MKQALDLFCGVGGVARGLHRRGYETVGVDIEPQPKYPGEFHQADLRDGLPPEVVGRDYDLVWASPACTFATKIQAFRSGENLIPLARDLLDEVDAPVKIIENVPGARDELRSPVQLDGSAFGLGVRKRRCFETNFPAFGTPAHKGYDFEFCIGDRESPVEEYREAHGFDRDCALAAKELREAIPPAYVGHLLDEYERYGVQETCAVADGGTTGTTGQEDA